MENYNSDMSERPLDIVARAMRIAGIKIVEDMTEQELYDVYNNVQDFILYEEYQNEDDNFTVEAQADYPCSSDNYSVSLAETDLNQKLVNEMLNYENLNNIPVKFIPFNSNPDPEPVFYPYDKIEKRGRKRKNYLDNVEFGKPPKVKRIRKSRKNCHHQQNLLYEQQMYPPNPMQHVPLDQMAYVNHQTPFTDSYFSNSDSYKYYDNNFQSMQSLNDLSYSQPSTPIHHPNIQDHNNNQPYYAPTSNSSYLDENISMMESTSTEPLLSMPDITNDDFIFEKEPFQPHQIYADAYALPPYTPLN